MAPQPRKRAISRGVVETHQSRMREIVRPFAVIDPDTCRRTRVSRRAIHKAMLMGLVGLTASHNDAQGILCKETRPHARTSSRRIGGLGSMLAVSPDLDLFFHIPFKDTIVWRPRLSRLWNSSIFSDP
jgi:hypothetical protein